MLPYQLNNPARGMPFQMVSASAPYAGVPGLSPLPTVEIAKDCGEFQPALGEVVEMGFGWYALLGHVQDRNTLGSLVVHGAVADPSVQCVDPTYLISNSVAENDGQSDSQNLATLVSLVERLVTAQRA